MFNSLKNRLPADAELPQRAHALTWLGRVLDGTLYDALPHDFHTERNAAGEYIPLRERRPSVRYALCKTVVHESVSLLFSDGHFPALQCADAALRQALLRLIAETRLNEVMIEAATRGSVGSVAIRLRVLGNRLFFDVLPTTFLTPEWRAEAPDTLARVCEQYKVRGRALRELGYAVGDDELGADFWFRRVWDAQAETWYLPWRAGTDATPVVDGERSTTHRLGFVPLLWVRNLPGGNEIDGACTFADAVDTAIEIDYLLSQAGRGLKYSADPTLLIKEPALGSDDTLIRGAGNAITVSAEGDARLLEINGSAAGAVIDFVRCLRELALESIHGNRASADRIAAAQSGRALELMQQALLGLADRLRVSYGEGGLLELLGMAVRASQVYRLQWRDGSAVGVLPPGPRIELRWPAWFAPLSGDLLNRARAVGGLVQAGVLDAEAARGAVADDLAIADVTAERQRPASA